MKLIKASLGILLVAGLASCANETSTTETTSGDTTVVTGPMETTTTTVTTTSKPAMFTPAPGVEYMDLRSKKMIKVRVDTVHHYIVNEVTNQPVDFIIQPGTTDTIYGRSMRIANRAIRYNSANDWTYDESLLNQGDNMNTNNQQNVNDAVNSAAAGDANKVKIKEKDDKTKIKIKKED